MTDVRARENLGPAFDEKTPSRRQLLRAGVWAAPVIVLATAAPAAASQSATVVRAQAVVKYSFSAYDEAAAGRIKGSIRLGYDTNAFTSQPTRPSTMTVSWEVVAINSAGVVTVIKGATNTLAQYGNTTEVSYAVNGLAAGSYTVRLRTTLVSFSPNPVTQPNGSQTRFESPLTSWDLPFKVT